MERTEIMGKDVILHKEMSQQEREKELERLKAESDNLKNGKSRYHQSVGRWYFFVPIYKNNCDVANERR